MDDLIKNENCENKAAEKVTEENVNAVELKEKESVKTEDTDVSEYSETQADSAPLQEDVSQESVAPEQPVAKKKSKVGVVIGVIVAVLLIATAVVCVFLFANSGSHSDDENELNLFSESLISVCKDEKWGYVNESGEVVIDYQFEDAGIFTEDGLAYVKSNGKYGYIDKTGTYVVNPQYDAVRPFCDGLAAVRQDKTIGYINTVGEMVIKSQYDDAYSFKNGYAVVVTGDVWGLIDETGKYAVNPQYDATEWQPLQIAALLQDTSNVEDLLIAVERNEKYGYIDINGNVVIPYQFDDADRFNEEGIAVVTIGEKSGLIDKTGKYIINAKYDDISSTDSAKGIYSFETDGKYGLVSIDGTEIAAPQFDGIISLDNGYFLVALGDRYGIIDEMGKYVVNPTYSNFEAYKNGLIIVEKDDKLGYINLNGEVVVDFQFDDAAEFMNCGLARVKINDKYGYINTTGEYVINATYHQASMMYDDGFAWVIGDDKKVSIINAAGEAIISGLDGIAGDKKIVCEEKDCYNFAETDETLCEKHLFDFNKILNDLGYSNSSYVSVYDDGMSLMVTTYYYSSIEEFDDGAAVAIKLAEYFGCYHLEDTISGDTINRTHGRYNIKITCDYYSFGSGNFYFRFEASENQTV